jgi:hypothetical protein
MLNLIIYCVILHTAAANDVEAPVVGRPSEGFYGAVGEHVQLTLLVSPRAVRVEDPVELTVAVTGIDNPAQIQRPDLRGINEYSSRFYIDDLPDEGPIARQRRFHYRLRPRNEHVNAIPPLVFRYYDPKMHYFATTTSMEELSLVVTPRNTSTDLAGQSPKIDGPDWQFDAVPDSTFLREQHSGIWLDDSWTNLVATLALILPAIGFCVWLIWWRQFNPDAAKLARLRRAHAVRTALDALKRAVSLPRVELGDQSAAIVRSFLQERLGLPNHCVTATEIEQFLKQSHLPESLIARATMFFRDCDFARFGPPGGIANGLTTTAEQLILDMEGLQ